jgi:predicted molibdopterin-dependent oxidoreductase YjgC
MEVETDTPEVQKLRREILELILSEHPNACLICSEKKNCDEYKSTIRKVGETTGCVLCPNNGRCELQDVVEALKVDVIRFPSLYRNFEIKKGDPFFDRNYNLCILCGRCVRVCHELRGASVVHFTYRGSQAVIGTALDKTLLESGCQFCGACVDVCPTGALTERGIKYEGLPEEKIKTICPLCSIGCELEIELRGGKILSSVPAEDGAANKGQACVKGRFLVRDVVYSKRRVLKPLVRLKQGLRETGWDEALDFVAQGLMKYKGEQVALVISPQLSSEESFLFHKFARDVLRTENIVSTADFSPLAAYHQAADENGLLPELNFKMEELSSAKTILLAGADLPVSHPIVWLEVLKAVRNGAKLIVVSPIELSLNRFSALWLRIKPETESYVFAFLSKLLLETGGGKELSATPGFDAFKESLDELEPSKILEMTGIAEKEMKEAGSLLEKNSAVFLFGTGLAQQPGQKQNLFSLWNLALQTKARLFPLGSENNLRGELEVRRVFRAKAKTFEQIVEAVLSKKIKALFLAGSFPRLEKVRPEFLVVQDSFVSEHLETADAALPAATFAENEGSFINFEGRVQRFRRVIKPLGEARPDWLIISDLARRMGHRGFDYKNSSAILKEMSESFLEFSSWKQGKEKDVFVQEKKSEKNQFIPLKLSITPRLRENEYPFLMLVDYSLDEYRNLSLFEESSGLRRMRNSRWVKVSAEDADRLKLKEGERVVVESRSGRTDRMVKIAENLPEGIVTVNFTWNEDSSFSVANLFSSASPGSFFLGALPVRIERGK